MSGKVYQDVPVFASTGISDQTVQCIAESLRSGIFDTLDVEAQFPEHFCHFTRIFDCIGQSLPTPLVFAASDHQCMVTVIEADIF